MQNATASFLFERKAFAAADGFADGGSAHRRVRTALKSCTMDIQWRSSDSQAFASYGSEIGQHGGRQPGGRHAGAHGAACARTCWPSGVSGPRHHPAPPTPVAPAIPRRWTTLPAISIGSFTRKNALCAIPHRSLDQAVGHVWSGTMAARCPICNLAARQARDSPADPRNTHASLGCFRCVLGAGGCHVESCTYRSLQVESSR